MRGQQGNWKNRLWPSHLREPDTKPAGKPKDVSQVVKEIKAAREKEKKAARESGY